MPDTAVYVKLCDHILEKAFLAFWVVKAVKLFTTLWLHSAADTAEPDMCMTCVVFFLFFKQS